MRPFLIVRPFQILRLAESWHRTRSAWVVAASVTCTLFAVDAACADTTANVQGESGLESVVVATGRELVGETLDFRVRWGAVPAGAATFAVDKVGRERLHFKLDVRTSPFVDLFYRVRDRFGSTVLADNLRSLRYEKQGEEGKRRRDELVRFHREPPSATYSRDGAPREPIETPDVVHDPLAALYAFRLAPAEGDAVELDVSDGKRSVRGEVVVLGREIVTTPAGTFETVKVEPKLEGVGGVFRRSPGARVFLWLTDDRWRRPVKLQSEVAVGAFTAELVAGSHGDWVVASAEETETE